jgi:hypothetical protein
MAQEEPRERRRKTTRLHPASSPHSPLPSPGLMGGALSSTEVDLIFVKSKPKFERRLGAWALPFPLFFLPVCAPRRLLPPPSSYSSHPPRPAAFEHFLDALAAMAERKFPTMAPQDGLRQLISAHLVPHYDMVQVEMSKSGETEVPLSGVYKKLYDPRSYTGVYAERFRSGDGRINGESDSRPGKDDGAGGGAVHDIADIMRPGLRAAAPAPQSPAAAMAARAARGAGAGAAASPPANLDRLSSGRRAAAGASGPSAGAQAEALRAALSQAQRGDPSALMALTVALADQVTSMQQQQQRDGGGGAAAAASGRQQPQPQPRAAAAPLAPAPAPRAPAASRLALHAEVEELADDIAILSEELEGAKAAAAASASRAARACGRAHRCACAAAAHPAPPSPPSLILPFLQAARRRKTR